MVVLENCMIARLLLLMIIFTACRSGEIACPEIKTVKLNKRPANYMRTHSRSLSASARSDKDKIHSKAEIPQHTRPVKSSDSIEEWDCPKPGSKTTVPKAVRENIKKNRKKFDSYYRTRHHSDSLQAARSSKPPR